MTRLSTILTERKEVGKLSIVYLVAEERMNLLSLSKVGILMMCVLYVCSLCRTKSSAAHRGTMETGKFEELPEERGRRQRGDG